MSHTQIITALEDARSLSPAVRDELIEMLKNNTNLSPEQESRIATALEQEITDTENKHSKLIAQRDNAIEEHAEAKSNATQAAQKVFVEFIQICQCSLDQFISEAKKFAEQDDRNAETKEHNAELSQAEAIRAQLQAKPIS